MTKGPRAMLPPEPVDHTPLEESASSRVSPGRALRALFVEAFETIAPAFVIALLINLFLAQSTYVYGQSMEPNLHTDQRLIVEKVSYKLHTPRRGDIVVLDLDTSDVPLIKRVIGLPGETVEIRENQVFIDGVPLQEEYLSDVVQRDYGPHTVGMGHVFVMGDNRRASNDSRYFGAVPIARIVGRAWLSYWPLQDVRLF
jgi:signal peptidase I